MFAFAYPAKLTAGGDGRILVEFVDLPRVATDGKDAREAWEEAMDALGSDLSIRLSRREEIPVPSIAKRGHRLVPDSSFNPFRIRPAGAAELTSQAGIRLGAVPI